MLPSRHAASDDVLRRSVRVTMPSDGGRGPSVHSLIVLAISALALIATTPPPPTLAGRVIGEVVINGGETVERELRIHVDPAAGQPVSGSIYLSYQAGSGLQTSYTRDATLTFVAASDAGGSFAPESTFPVDRCEAGCNLVYRIRIAAGRDVLPGSVIRYEVEVQLQYQYSSASLDSRLMRLELDGQAVGPVATIWAVLAGVLALVGGIAVGPVVHRALAPRRRRLPGLALLLLGLGLMGWLLLRGAVYLSSVDVAPMVARSPIQLLTLADPWSLALLGTLSWGVWRGLRRWPADGGWVLGLAAVAMVALAGLWLAFVLTLDAVVQPVVIALPFVLLGALGGIVIGQAWRTDDRAKHDRWWAALAVVGNGIIVAGFVFLAEQSLFDPFATSPLSLLALIPAALVVLAFRRWLRGRPFWLALFDFMIAATGLLGLWLWSSSFVGFSTAPSRLETDDVGVFIAVAASLVALVTSFHTMPRTPTVDPRPPVTLQSAVDDRPTT